jgi:hypothetical protein
MKDWVGYCKEVMSCIKLKREGEKDRRRENKEGQIK